MSNQRAIRRKLAGVKGTSRRKQRLLRIPPKTRKAIRTALEHALERTDDGRSEEEATE